VIRTQISFTEDEFEFLKRAAMRSGGSLASVVRRAVDEIRRKQDERLDRALRYIGAFEADLRDRRAPVPAGPDDAAR
jgi:hypothetical protein